MSTVTEKEVETAISEDNGPRVYRDLEELLKEHGVRLLDPRGQEIEIPPKMYEMMLNVAHLLAREKVVLITPMDKNLTTQEAADYLGISRPTLVKLLEEGAIPFTRTGTHRRVRFENLQRYREITYAEHKRLLDELTQMSEEMGGYDVSPEDIKAFIAA